VTEATRDLLKRALALPPDERARLAREIVASLEDEDSHNGELEVTPEWLTEIERRARDVSPAGQRFPTLEESLDRLDERLAERRRPRGG
jgi:putative addiction module component (TIGR02574 family)